MILVFAGAGASAAVDAKKYPTTEGVYSMLPSSITGDPLFTQVKGFLQAGNPKTIDIEHVLAALEEISNYLWQTSDISRIVGFMTQKDAFRMINGNFSTSHLHSAFPDLSDRCYDLIVSIKEFLYNTYGQPPEEKKLDSWRILIEQLQAIDPAIEIFTTNYDTILENLIDMDNLNIKSGNISGRHSRLDMDLWNHPGLLLDDGYGRLTKLHGSVDWQRHLGSNDYIFTCPVYTGDLQKQVALFPGGTKKEPGEWPFVKFYKHFERSVERAKQFVFIGFSFRDEYINRILQEGAAAAKKYIITKDSQYPLPNFLQSDKKVEHNDRGFTKNSVNDCLAYLIP